MNNILRLAALLVCAALAACAGLSQNGATPIVAYRCETGIEFTARFADDTAVLDTASGREVLYRDAGGTGEQTVYGNRRVRAEFGLGSGGRQALLRYLLSPLVVRCTRE